MIHVHSFQSRTIYKWEFVYLDRREPKVDDELKTATVKDAYL